MRRGRYARAIARGGTALLCIAGPPHILQAQRPGDDVSVLAGAARGLGIPLGRWHLGLTSVTAWDSNLRFARADDPADVSQRVGVTAGVLWGRARAQGGLAGNFAMQRHRTLTEFDRTAYDVAAVGRLRVAPRSRLSGEARLQRDYMQRSTFALGGGVTAVTALAQVQSVHALAALDHNLDRRHDVRADVRWYQADTPNAPELGGSMLTGHFALGGRTSAMSRWAADVESRRGDVAQRTVTSHVAALRLDYRLTRLFAVRPRVGATLFDGVADPVTPVGGLEVALLGTQARLTTHVERTAGQLIGTGTGAPLVTHSGGVRADWQPVDEVTLYQRSDVYRSETRDADGYGTSGAFHGGGLWVAVGGGVTATLDGGWRRQRQAGGRAIAASSIALGLRWVPIGGRVAP